MTAPMWADASYTPFGIADEPVYEPVVEFGTAATYADAELFLASLDDAKHCASCRYSGLPLLDESMGRPYDCCCQPSPALDATGAPVIEWAPATREQIGDGDIIRVTQVGTWKGTRLTGKVTTYERRTSST